MGNYLNPDNIDFRRALNSEIRAFVPYSVFAEFRTIICPAAMHLKLCLNEERQIIIFYLKKYK